MNIILNRNIKHNVNLYSIMVDENNKAYIIESKAL